MRHAAGRIPASIQSIASPTQLIISISARLPPVLRARPTHSSACPPGNQLAHDHLLSASISTTDHYHCRQRLTLPQFGVAARTAPHARPPTKFCPATVTAASSLSPAGSNATSMAIPNLSHFQLHSLSLSSALSLLVLLHLHLIFLYLLPHHLFLSLFLSHTLSLRLSANVHFVRVSAPSNAFATSRQNNTFADRQTHNHIITLTHTYTT